jgi:mRNA interferase MazF
MPPNASMNPSRLTNEATGRIRSPDRRGDLVRFTLHPQAGREQSGRGPALVPYNRRAGLALVCPITTRKGYPFEVSLLGGLPVSGVVLADHMKIADWSARRAEFAARAPGEAVEEVTARLRELLGIWRGGLSRSASPLNERPGRTARHVPVTTAPVHAKR